MSCCSNGVPSSSDAIMLRTLIVGLGNHTLPNTRHNIGMMFVDRLAAQHSAQWATDRSLLASVAKVTLPRSDGRTHELILLRPRLYMNENGKAVAKAVKHYLGDVTHVNECTLWLIQDDLDRPLGKWGFKEGGSANGHNGVRSAQSCLKTDKIHRLRIGIDRPANKSDVVNYVLQEFTATEQRKVPEALDSSIAALCARLERCGGPIGFGSTG